MGSISAPIIGGVISGVGSLAGGLFSSSAASDAAQTQAAALTQAAQIQQQEFSQIQTNLKPYMDLGVGGVNKLTAALPGLTTPFNPTIESLAATPGYQFTLDQGRKAVQNSFAAQGLGSSGAAIKGATNYAEGLAGTTYQQQFSNYLAQSQQIYNMLAGLVSTGQSAAAGQGSLGLQAASQAGQAIAGAGAAQAGGIVGSANALSGGISGATSNIGLYLALNNSGLFGSAGHANVSADYGGPN